VIQRFWRQQISSRLGPRSSAFIEGKSIGDGVGGSSGATGRTDRRNRPGRMPGQSKPLFFYLPVFVKKFTYSGVVYTFSFSADRRTDNLAGPVFSAGQNDDGGLIIGGSVPSLRIDGGTFSGQNTVDGCGLVSGRHPAASAARLARQAPDRPDPQLPIEEELYG
jgi:hypothetical protein